MSDERIVRDYLARHGRKLIENGYTVVPIQQGKKAPGFDGWQKSKGSVDQVNQWLDSGFKNAGVGLLTKYTCAADIDTMDEAAALHFERLFHERVGKAPVRIGKAPKRLLLFRASEPFKKRRSSVYRDEWGDKQMIEALGDGQQFVAFHVHPDTGKPYTWVDDVSPLTVRASELPEITVEQIEEIIAEFEKYAEAQGWTVEKAARNVGSKAGAVDADNPWVEDSRPVEISVDELRSRLMLVPGAEDYDTWTQTGMALYHQFDGGEDGFALWSEWSETADNFDPDALERHWKSFDVTGKGKAPVTARLILRLSREATTRTSIELSVKIKDAFMTAKNLEEWEKAKAMVREAEIDGLTRSAIAAVAKDRMEAISGSKISLVEIKKAIAYKPKKPEKTPGWCEGWVYDVSDDRFFHIERKISVTKQGFDAMYDRYAVTKSDVLNGNNGASHSASDLALTYYCITSVDGRRYMPGHDAIFIEPDGKFANTYPEHEIPKPPEQVLPRDKKNIQRVKDHIGHLIADEREQRMLLDWLSWVVQNPGKHVNYAVLLQGVEGDGKSFFAELMRAVMGVSNVTMLNAASVLDSTFTDWAHGQCLACVEEVRVVGRKSGSDKWDAINRIKPFITNRVIEVHPKGKAVINVINTTSYMMFSNYKDALPLDDNSRRYLVLFSRWQRKEDIGAFKEKHPDYYVRLYSALSESPESLRKWLLSHEQHDDFDPLGDAPVTAARKVMIRKSKTEFIQVLDDIIAEDETAEASADLVEVTGLSDAMVARGVDWPSPKALMAQLERDGYEHIGRVRLSSEYRGRFYSRNPAMFQCVGKDGMLTVDEMRVRKYMRERRERLNSADEL